MVSKVKTKHHNQEIDCVVNSPFYSCVLGYQAYEQEWG